MEWCKLYAEWGTDPKVQSMSEAMRCRHAMLLCLRCTNDPTRLSEDEIQYYLHITTEELVETKALFLRKGFIDKNWNVVNWSKRQDYVSPSARRMRAVRERQRNELRNGATEDELVAHDMETSCATQGEQVAQLARASEEQSRIEQNRKDPPFRGTRGKRPPKPPLEIPSWMPTEEWDEWLKVRTKKRAVNTPYALGCAIEDLDKLRRAGEDPAAVLKQSIVRGYTGLFPINGNAGNGPALQKSAPRSHVRYNPVHEILRNEAAREKREAEEKAQRARERAGKPTDGLVGESDA